MDRRFWMWGGVTVAIVLLVTVLISYRHHASPHATFTTDTALITSAAPVSSAPIFETPKDLSLPSVAGYVMEQVTLRSAAGYAFYQPYFKRAFQADGLVWPSKPDPAYDVGIEPVNDLMMTARKQWTPTYGADAITIAQAASYAYGGRQL